MRKKIPNYIEAINFIYLNYMEYIFLISLIILIINTKMKMYYLCSVMEESVPLRSSGRKSSNKYFTGTNLMVKTSAN